MFGERPYDEVSMEDIGAAAGVSKALVFHYFPTKEEFYVASLKIAADGLLEATEPIPALPKPMRLFASLTAYLDYVDRFAVSFVVLMTGGVGASREAGELVERTRQTVLDRITIAMEVDARTMKPALRLALRGWIAFVEATSIDWLARRDLPRDELLAMWLGSFASTISAAQIADPTIEIDIGE